MNLITLKSVQHGFGGPPLLENASFSIAESERICLIGRNGEGKSTLLKIIAGHITPDSGEVARSKGLVIAELAQEVPQGFEGTVFDIVAGALGDKARLLKKYHHAVQLVAAQPDEQSLQKLADAQHALEAVDGWQLEQEVETVISRLQLHADAEVASLSGGLKRRVLLARALVTHPDLLLLDEPTNHLDLAAIQWMEEFFRDYKASILFITHDREFLRQLATRIIELDRGQTTDWPGNYDNYLRRREERLNAEAKENERFDKKLAQEEVWIRQGIKARRTRNEGRVRALKAMREAYRQRRTQQGTANLQMHQAENSGKLVCEAENITYSWDGFPVVKDFSLTILRGDRIGVIGPNGAGKSTLLNLLLGRLEPQQGKVKLGTKLEVVFFDQLRDVIDDEKTVMDNVAEGSDKVEINGKTKHIMSYLQDFLFAPQRVRQPAGALSGGERNRLLLAKLFLKPANLLVLDEPTNDLDVETLELLEELLTEYQGTLLIVSHDRQFLDNVVTSTLVLEGNGHVEHSIGGYSDWEEKHRQKQQALKATATKLVQKEVEKKENNQQNNKKIRPTKLSYKDQRELDELPKQLESLEKRLDEVQSQLSNPDIYKESPDKVAALQQQLTDTEAELEEKFLRWEELEAML